ncbi:MAG: hypothetical protein R6U44_01530 [Archaeoglobaceae archaeon]
MEDIERLKLDDFRYEEFLMTEKLNEEIRKLSLTKLLQYSGKWNRKKSSIYIEKVYLDILDQWKIKKSDLINDLLEIYLREMGLLDLRDHLEEWQIERLKDKLDKEEY